MSIIHKTTDYSQFRFLDRNRDISHKYLVDSIRKNNLLHCNPIKVNKNFEVIDGQNRLKAAQDLGVPIYYIILSELTEEDIPTFQVQNSWKLEDYLKFYRSSNHDYEFVGKMMEKFKLKTNFVINCCGSVSYPERMFRNGTYKITKDKNRLEECFGKFKEVFDSCRVICGKDVDEVSVAGCYAIWSLVNHKEYDHERMLAKCDKNKSEVSIAFEFRERAHIFTRLLDLYNLNTKKGRIAAPAALKKKGAKYVED